MCIADGSFEREGDLVVVKRKNRKKKTDQKRTEGRGKKGNQLKKRLRHQWVREREREREK